MKRPRPLSKAELLKMRRAHEREWGPVIAPMKAAVAASKRLTAADYAVRINAVKDPQ